MSSPQNSLADDLLNGAAAIAAYLGWDRRKVYHYAAKGYLPTFHVGSSIVARKSELTRHLSAVSDPNVA